MFEVNSKATIESDSKRRFQLHADGNLHKIISDCIKYIEKAIRSSNNNKDDDNNK